MSVCVVSVVTMTTVVIVGIMSVIVVIIWLCMTARFFLSLADHIRLIPGCLDEYLECRVQMYDEYEEDDSDDDEYDEEKELESEYRDECEETRYQERDDEE